MGESYSWAWYTDGDVDEAAARDLIAFADQVGRARMSGVACFLSASA